MGSKEDREPSSEPGEYDGESEDNNSDDDDSDNGAGGATGGVEESREGSGPQPSMSTDRGASIPPLSTLCPSPPRQGLLTDCHTETQRAVDFSTPDILQGKITNTWSTEHPHLILRLNGATAEHAASVDKGANSFLKSALNERNCWWGHCLLQRIQMATQSTGTGTAISIAATPHTVTEAHASRLVDVWVDSDNVVIEQGLTNLSFLLHDLVTETLAPIGPQTEAVVVPQIRQTIGQVDPKSDDMSQSIPPAVRFEKGI